MRTHRTNRTNGANSVEDFESNFEWSPRFRILNIQFRIFWKLDGNLTGKCRSLEKLLQILCDPEMCNISTTYQRYAAFHSKITSFISFLSIYSENTSNNQ
jgi:hypothetical protein